MTRWRFSSNAFELGMFSFNVAGGLAQLKTERWDGSWEKNLAVARLAEEAGLEFLLPLEALENARQRGDTTYNQGAASAHVDGRRLVLQMRNGASAGIDIASIPHKRIAKASQKELSRVEVSSLGDYVWFPRLDEGYSVPALLDLSFGAAIRSKLGKVGGRKSTAAKRAAARKNGTKGGRPRKKKAATPATRD
jgi:hypothetical protein